MASTIRVELVIDSKGAVTGIRQASGEVGGLNTNIQTAQKEVGKFGRVVETAFGFILANLVQSATRRIKAFASEIISLTQNIQDVDSEFNAVFRNVFANADEFTNRFSKMTGFTVTESRKIVASVAGIAQSLGESEGSALRLAERSAELALQWERISGQDFDRNLKLIELALAGNVMQLQRMGIVSRDVTLTQFQQMTMQQRLDIVTRGLTARYGDLSEAGDGLTQQVRQLNGLLNSLQDRVLRALIPEIGKVLTEIKEWIETNDDLIEDIEKIAKFLAVDMVRALLGFIEGLRDLNKELAETEEKAREVGRWIGRLQRIMWEANPLILQLRANIWLLNKILGDTTETTYGFIRSTDAAAQSVEKQTLRVGNFAEGMRIANTALKEFMDGMQEMVETSPDVDATFNVIERSADELVEQFLGVKETGEFSIEGINSALRELQIEMEGTADPGRRQQLLDYIEALGVMRDAAIGAHETFDDWSVFMQTTMANALSHSIMQFTDMFETIGAGGDKMAQAMLKSLLSIIRGIGQQLIAWGTARLIMTAGTDPRGWAAVGYGTTLAGLSSLATGALSASTGGSGGASGATGGGGGMTATRVSTPTASGMSPSVAQSTTASFRKALQDVKWTASTNIKMGELVVEIEGQLRKRGDTT
jgi:hypothetical protein